MFHRQVVKKQSAQQEYENIPGVGVDNDMSRERRVIVVVGRGNETRE